MTGRLTDGIGRWSVIALLCGCGGADGAGAATGETGSPGAQTGCADPVFFDLTLTGDVTDGGAPAPGVTVRLEERVFAPGTVHAEGTTDAQGRFSLAATDLPIVDGCLGWAMGFYAVADDGERTAEWPINSVISGAWLRGESTADLSGMLDLE